MNDALNRDARSGSRSACLDESGLPIDGEPGLCGQVLQRLSGELSAKAFSQRGQPTLPDHDGCWNDTLELTHAE